MAPLPAPGADDGESPPPRESDAYVAHTHPRSVFLTGSAAEGISDAYSDLDLIMHYDALPPQSAVDTARAALGSTETAPIGASGDGAFGESGTVDGVEVQVGHGLVAAWEREMDDVLVRHDPASTTHKALGGLLDAIPLHGEAFVRAWQRRAEAYPAELSVAVIRHYLRFMPLWYLHDRFAARDATVFAYQMLVEGALNVLGVLAGLNRLYFHPFQFKRMRRFVSQMERAPERVADRIDGLFATPRPQAFYDFEQVVREALDLVDAQAPHVSTERARRFLGRRQEPVAQAGSAVARVASTT